MRLGFTQLLDTLLERHRAICEDEPTLDMRATAEQLVRETTARLEKWVRG